MKRGLVVISDLGASERAARRRDVAREGEREQGLDRWLR